jgi:hypothetical protein
MLRMVKSMLAQDFASIAIFFEFIVLKRLRFFDRMYQKVLRQNTKSRASRSWTELRHENLAIGSSVSPPVLK